MPATVSDCDAVADLLDALADGELPPPLAAEVEGHLASCAACAGSLEAIRGLRRGLAALPREAAPDRLRQRVLEALPAQPLAAAPRRRWLELAAASVAGLSLGLGGSRWWLEPTPLAEHDMLAAHGRALLSGAPPQVPAGNPHRVRPWLSEHLPMAPRVEDPEGFPLQGARLDLVAGQPVAAILYRRREHAITVFAAPAEQAPDWPSQARYRRGFSVLPWTVGGLRYVAISDLNMAEMHALALALGAPGGG